MKFGALHSSTYTTAVAPIQVLAQPTKASRRRRRRRYCCSVPLARRANTSADKGKEREKKEIKEKSKLPASPAAPSAGLSSLLPPPTKDLQSEFPLLAQGPRLGSCSSSRYSFPLSHYIILYLLHYLLL